MTPQEKVEKLLKYLSINAKAFSEALGYQRPQIIYDLLNGKTKSISNSFANKIVSVYPEISYAWLLTGEGEMLKGQSNAKEIGGAYVATSQDDEVVMVPFIPISAQASFIDTLTSISNDTWLDTLPVVPTDAERANIDAYRIFEVEGDSMTPTVPNGALVLAQEMPEARWHYAEGVVVIGYAEYIVIKRIEKNRLATDNYLILSSDNPRYGSMQVAFADIRCIYRAKRIISADIN